MFSKSLFLSRHHLFTDRPQVYCNIFCGLQIQLESYRVKDTLKKEKLQGDKSLDLNGSHTQKTM